MRSGELVKLLQRLDPNGKTEVNVFGDPGDVLFVEKVPACCDGYCYVFTKDADDYIFAIKITGNGERIVIHSYSLKDAILQNPDIRVDIDVEGTKKKEFRKLIVRLKKEVKDLEKENGFE